MARPVDQRQRGYPRISLITPSLNQGEFIEQTIRSVLAQNYPNLDYLVVDGGSQDGTLDVLRRYSGALRWLSEPDAGQSDAINKGLRLAGGEILGYLNSDDLLLPGSLWMVGEFFRDHPPVQWVTGYCTIIDRPGREIRRWVTGYKNFLLRHYHYTTLLIVDFISQMATFWRRGALQGRPFFSIGQHYVMDYEYWLRLGQRSAPGIIRQPLACFRMYSTSKSVQGFTQQFRQSYQVARRFTRNPLIRLLSFLHAWLIIAFYRWLVGRSDKPERGV